MHMIGHPHKIVNLKLACRDIRTQHIDEQGRIPLGLQQGSAMLVFVVTKNVRDR